MRKKKELNSNKMLSSIFCVAGEMIEGNGEDSYYYEAVGNKVIVSVFDGCGGIGSRRYNNYSGKTGAFVASRAVCGSVKQWFENASDMPEELCTYIRRSLNTCDKYADKGGRLMGSLGKSFPTTAAIICADTKSGGTDINCFWAGDSRCYMLDADGLHQITDDDVDGEDALSNISGDGVLTNVISHGKPFELHNKKMYVKGSCILFSATDGCFGYLNTPVDFEYLLLSCLMNANNISEWKAALDGSIKEYTGDDYSLCMASFGYNDFASMKEYFAKRFAYITKEYVNSDKSNGEKWSAYKEKYSIYLK